MQVQQNLVYGRSNGGQPLTEDVYSPKKRTKPAPLVFVIHGGGFTSGDKQGTAAYAAALAAAGFVTINLNYSLTSPGYPEQVKEIQRAIQWNVARARKVEGDPRRVGILGFSAGGYLGAMASLLDNEQRHAPRVDAVATLSAPLDLPALDQLLRARLAACGYRSFCPQMPHMPPLGAFGTLFRFLGCPTGKCSSRLISEASPSSHVTARAPAFLLFNSTDELIPSSQPTDMADALRGAGAPVKVVSIAGTAHAAGYVSQVSPAILRFLRKRLGVSTLRVQAGADPPAPSGGITLLVICCALIVAGSLALILLAVRRRRRDADRHATASR